jgi:hypothetical protein
MRRLLCIAVIIAALAGLRCAPAASTDQGTLDESIKYDLRVQTDQIFGYTEGSEIGEVYFSDTRGLVGTRIHCVLTLKEWERFQDATLVGLIELDNVNAIKDTAYSEPFEVTSERTDIFFYIPQIRSVPTILNFTFSISYEENNDVFLATQDYQFVVNKGQPAT